MVTADLDGNGKKQVLIDFPGWGIWVWFNNASWFQLHPLNARQMTVGDFDGNGQADVVVDFAGCVDGNGKSDLIVDFGASYGTWLLQNGSAWSQIDTRTSRSRQRVGASVDTSKPAPDRHFKTGHHGRRAAET